MMSGDRLDTYHFYEQNWDSWNELRESFEWDVPDRFNMADYVCDRWAADDDRVALFAESPDGSEEVLTYAQLDRAANQLANYLRAEGIGRDDAIVLHGSQTKEALITFVTAWKLGAVAVPVSTLLGPDAIEYRLEDCNASAFVADNSAIDPLRNVADPPASLDVVLTNGDGDSRGDEVDFDTAIDGESPEFENATTRADDTACIIYTSGTTGPPKGTLLPHRVLLGHLPQFVTVICNMELRDDDLVWTPVEWTWVASTYVRVFPSLFYGLPLVAYDRDRFDPEVAFGLIERYEITIIGAAPTALRMMTDVDPTPYDVESVRVIGGGGESFDESLRAWSQDVFGDVAVHEGYGQTESNALVGECTALKEHRQDKMGAAGVGHDVHIVDPVTAERESSPGTIGEIALRMNGDPVTFDAYLNRPEETAAKRQNGYHLTGDLGTRDEDGYFAFKGRKDDVIICSGYRIGPQEIEDHLLGHEAVAGAGVIGVPDDVRGEVPKAFVVLSDGRSPSEEVRTELQSYVKENLAKYEYPRRIEFLDELPTTTTGKIRRTALEEREGLLDSG